MARELYRRGGSAFETSFAIVRSSMTRGSIACVTPGESGSRTIAAKRGEDAMRIGCGLALVVTLCGSTLADDRIGLPKYDPDYNCSFLLKSNVWMKDYLKIHYINNCISEEQSSYDYLHTIWFKASNQAEVHCIGVNNSLDGRFRKYSVLGTCIDRRYKVEQLKSAELIHFRP